MLVYGLAIVVAIGSLLLYAIALRFPMLSRRSDVIWSGFGLFYALVLWVCGEQLTGAVLLSQGTVVGLLAWQGWQTLVLREQVVRSTADPIAATSLPNFAGWAAIAQLFRPSDPQLSGWAAFKQSLLGLGLLIGMWVRSRSWSWPGERSGAIASPAADAQPTPTPTPAPPSPTPTTPTEGQVSESAGGGSTPVYVRKKYRQPADAAPAAPVASPVPVPSPAPPVSGAEASAGSSKPVYVRKKYRQALEADSAPGLTPESPAPSPAPAPEPRPESRPTAGRSPQGPTTRPPTERSPRRPAPAATVKLDGANLPDEIVVDYEDVPPRSPRPQRRSQP